MERARPIRPRAGGIVARLLSLDLGTVQQAATEVLQAFSDTEDGQNGVLPGLAVEAWCDLVNRPCTGRQYAEAKMAVSFCILAGCPQVRQALGLLPSTVALNTHRLLFPIQGAVHGHVMSLLMHQHVRSAPVEKARISDMHVPDLAVLAVQIRLAADTGALYGVPSVPLPTAEEVSVAPEMP